MICNEKGVLPKSEYFFFNPSEKFKEFYYYILVAGRFFCNQGYQIKREGNTDPILIYITDGELHLNYENKGYTARKDDILLIDCYKPHTYYSSSKCNFDFFHFAGNNSLSITNHLIFQNGGPLFKVTNNKKIRLTISELITKLYYKQPVEDIDLSYVVHTCLCLIPSFNQIGSISSLPTSDIISRTIHYIRNNIEKKISLKMLAKHAHLSNYYFSHLFKKETGITPIEYVSLAKINLGKTMLKTTQRTISEIADSLGYSSSSSFINAFTLRVGTSPAKFRNERI